MSVFSINRLINDLRVAILAALKPVLISGQKQRWKDDFNGTSLSSDWAISKNTANGQVVVTGSEAIIRSGTSIGTTAIKSTKSFKIPCKAAFIFKTINKATTQKFKISVINASGDNYAKFEVGSSGALVGIESANGSGFVSTGSMNLAVTTPSQQIFEIDLTFDDVRWSTAPINSGTSKQQTERRNTRIPLPSEDYYLEIEVENTAVVTESQLLLDSITLIENEIIQSEITAIRHNKNANDGVNISSFPNPATVTFNNASILVLNNSIYLADTIANLAANGTFTGSTKSMTNRGVLIVTVNTDVSGNLFIDESPDGTTWFTFPAYPCVPGGNLFKRESSMPNNRIRYINGASPTTAFRIASHIKSF